MPPPWKPNPGPQTVAVVNQADELYFGGSAGGGKTQLAIGLALTQHRNSLILRRTAVDTKAISEVFRTLPDQYGSWRSSGHGGEYRTYDGRTITVGGCQLEYDWKKYSGQGHDLIALDELPYFSQTQYQMLCAWNRVRHPDRYPNQRCRVVGPGNPPTGPEGDWVLHYWGPWLDPMYPRRAQPGELRWFVRLPTGEDQEVSGPGEYTFNDRTYHARSRTFIPARLEDNPAYMFSGYDAVLEALPEPLRSILRYGDMAAARQDDRWQLIPTRWVTEAQKRFLARQAEGLSPLSCLGVDVAASQLDGDQTVIAPRHGLTVAPLVKRPGRLTPDGQDVVALILPLWQSQVPVHIDATGIGLSAYNVSQMHNITAKRIIAAEKTDWVDSKFPHLRFVNLRSAMMWNVRLLLDPEGGPEETRLALPPDPELLGDLCAPRYALKLNGIGVESKEDIRERIGRSTDAGDAVAYSCWNWRSTLPQPIHTSPVPPLLPNRPGMWSDTKIR